jgi:hypothetical protein
MAKPAREPLPPLGRPSSAPAAARPKQHQTAGSNFIIATQLAKHLDLSRQRVQQLVDEHVIARLPNRKFGQDACGVAYLRWLRDPERRSARSEADARFIDAKTELLRMRVAEKCRDLIPRSEVDDALHAIAAIVTTHLGGMAARCTPDLRIRQAIDAVVHQVADERGEPPLGASGD